MDLTIIFLICIINIVTFTAVGFVLWFIFKSREFDFRERMELKRLHLDKMRTLKELEIKEKELEIRKEELNKNIELEREKLRMSTKLNFNGDVIETLDSMVAAYTEPFIKLKYTNAEKPLEENIFSEIIVPRFGTPRSKDMEEIVKKIFDDMPPDTRDIMNIYMTNTNLQELVTRMVTIYYQRVMYQMTKVKEEKAIEDNRAATRKRDWLFIRGKLNTNCKKIPKEAMDVLKRIQPRNFKEVMVAIDSMKNLDMQNRNDREIYEMREEQGYTALLNIDPNDLYDLAQLAESEGKEVTDL